MKLKVKVIQVNLKRNKIAKAGDIIDHTMLPVPETWPQLVKDGYFYETKETKAALKATKAIDESSEKSAKKAAKKAAKKEAKKAAEEAAKLNADDNGGDNADDNGGGGNDIELVKEMSKAEMVEFAKKKEIKINPKANKEAVMTDIISALEQSSE